MVVELRALVFSTRRYNDIRVVACITLTVFYVCTIMASTRNMYIRHRIQRKCIHAHIRRFSRKSIHRRRTDSYELCSYPQCRCIACLVKSDDGRQKHSGFVDYARNNLNVIEFID